MLALAIFCLRLACGLIGALLLLSPDQVNPRFYRTHFLTVLGLTGLATVSGWENVGLGLGVFLGGALVLAFLGSVVWSLEGAPGGRVLIVVAFLFLAVGLIAVEWTQKHRVRVGWLLAGDFTSAALLGTATTAMLMGHSYLIAPAMSIAPLLRLLAALVLAIGLRMLLAGLALWYWTDDHALTDLSSVTVLWLPLRWGLGFVGPLILAWMAWQTAKMRSTQSATGILYVVVIFCFLGELTSQLLLGNTGFTL